MFADPAALVSHFEASLAVVMIHLDAVWIVDDSQLICAR